MGKKALDWKKISKKVTNRDDDFGRVKTSKATQSQF